MIHSITWANYLLVIGLLLSIYYLFIGIRFYSRDIKALLSAKFKTSEKIPQVDSYATHAQLSIEPLQMELSFADTSEETFVEVEQLIEKLKAAIQKAASNASIKEEVINSLRLILEDHANLKGPPFQSAINELINKECKKLGFPMLSEAEIDRLWG